MLTAVAIFLFYPRLDPVIPNVPLHELPQPGGQIRGWLVPKILIRKAHVRVRVRNVAVSWHLDHVLLRLHIQQALQSPHQLRHRHRRLVPQIVNPQLRRPPLLAAAPGALLRRVERPQATLNDVVDVREVTRHLLPILRLVNINTLPLKNIFGEKEVSHVGPTPGTVHREEPQPREGKTVNMVVSVGNFLAGFLRCGVEARWPVGTVELREWVIGVESVHGARRGPDDRRLGVRGFGDF